MILALVIPRCLVCDAELRHLYLDGNCLAITADLLNLSSLTCLTVLKLSGNPVADDAGYRDTVCAVLPSLRVLDGTTVDRRVDGAVGTTDRRDAV